MPHDAQARHPMSIALIFNFACCSLKIRHSDAQSGVVLLFLRKIKGKDISSEPTGGIPITVFWDVADG
jgi:hypothetical protein